MFLVGGSVESVFLLDKVKVLVVFRVFFRNSLMAVFRLCIF